MRAKGAGQNLFNIARSSFVLTSSIMQADVSDPSWTL